MSKYYQLGREGKARRGEGKHWRKVFCVLGTEHSSVGMAVGKEMPGHIKEGPVYRA